LIQRYVVAYLGKKTQEGSWIASLKAESLRVCELSKL
jgi:hypothetical protein